MRVSRHWGTPKPVKFSAKFSFPLGKCYDLWELIRDDSRTWGCWPRTRLCNCGPSVGMNQYWMKGEASKKLTIRKLLMGQWWDGFLTQDSCHWITVHLWGYSHEYHWFPIAEYRVIQVPLNLSQGTFHPKFCHGQAESVFFLTILTFSSINSHQWFSSNLINYQLAIN